MNRSSEISIVATIHFVLAGLMVILASAALAGASFLGAFIGQMSGHPFGRLGGGLGFAIGGILSVGLLFRAALNFLCGWGVWNLKEWARILTIILCGLSLLFSVPRFFGMFFVFHMGVFGLWNLLWIAANVWIIYTLLQPQVRTQFQ